ncbi:unnamed protein product [Paramecium primaurelia]|uniref:Uncharacterized protein n=1 Tax=Paramecium primaurelia TaxID=5886 RepID=A0A8S1NYB7_PARPR|nr:unnamed protein product [Paramecium primaurelia]
MQILSDLQYLQDKFSQQSLQIRQLFTEIQQAQQTLSSLRKPVGQLRQSKSTIILHSTYQDSNQSPNKIVRNASLKQEDFIEQCLKKIEQANKTSNTNTPSPQQPKQANRIKGRLEKHIPEMKTQDEQIPLPTTSLQSIFQASNSPQQKLSKLMQLDDFKITTKQQKQEYFDIHEEGQLQN